jgi:8-oxo-dGTP diphosphatase
VSTDGELYERDPEAWNAYLAEGNAKQARKRVSADAIVRDSSGRILLVDPTYKSGRSKRSMCSDDTRLYAE